MQNGKIVRFAIRQDLADVAGLDWEISERQVRSIYDRLGENLYEQVVAICDDARWGDSLNDALLRTYFAACAFIAALESTLTQREPILRTLMDFLHGMEEQSGVQQRPLAEYLRSQAPGIDLAEGPRWNAASLVARMPAATRKTASNPPAQPQQTA